MLRKTLTYGAVLIGLFIVVNNASRAGQVFQAGASGSSKFVKTLQGR